MTASVWSGGGGEAIHAGFRERSEIERALILPISAQGIDGWMFVIGEQVSTPEAFAIASVLDAQIVAAFDKAAATVASKRAVSSEQRLRLARDLRDGILQFLAGAAMQLESIINGDGAADTPERLRALQDALVTEQRELRAFIRRMRPGAEQPLSGELELRPDFKALTERLESHWRVNVNLTINPPDARVPAKLQYELHQLVREAVANAVRHGQAKWINVSANRENGALHLTVADDGCGLGIHGQFDTRKQVELRVGPRSLRERITTLGGTIVVTSASLGAVVSMCVPRTNGGARNG